MLFITISVNQGHVLVMAGSHWISVGISFTLVTVLGYLGIGFSYWPSSCSSVVRPVSLKLNASLDGILSY